MIFKECIICQDVFNPKSTKQILCGKKACRLKRKQELRNTPQGKIDRNSYYIKNRNNWKGRHGLTKADAILFVEGKVCEVCGTDKRLIPDHCHESNKIRGVLCGQCNTAIGLLQDNLEGVEKAYDYLIRFRDRQSSS